MSARVVTAARGWIGTPYVHQASRKGAGCDCLGLIRGLWRELYGGEPEAAPAYTMDWDEPQGAEALWQAARRHLMQKALEDASPGDVILFRMRQGSVAKHLGVQSAVGENEMRAVAVPRGEGVKRPPRGGAGRALPGPSAQAGSGIRGAAFIHAYAGHGVVESPLSPPWQRRIVARFRFP